MKYEVVTGNVILGITGLETVILPIWLFGWELYCPVDEPKN